MTDQFHPHAPEPSRRALAAMASRRPHACGPTHATPFISHQEATMKRLTPIAARLLGTALLCLAPLHAALAVTDISNVPLASSSDFAASPNFMFILDDSGSMGWDYLPDTVNDSNVCKRRSDNSDECRAGDPPFYAAQFNTVFYNPAIRYLPAVNWDGSSMGNQSPTAAKVDAFDSGSGTINLTTNFPELVYCTNNSDSATDTSKCKRNGYNALQTSLLANGFLYPVDTNTSTLTIGAPINVNNASYPDSTYRIAKTRNGAAYYYTISPKEYCSDSALTTCQLATSASGTYTFPAPVRWCQDTTMANATTAQTGTSSSKPRCQAK